VDGIQREGEGWLRQGGKEIASVSNTGYASHGAGARQGHVPALSLGFIILVSDATGHAAPTCNMRRMAARPRARCRTTGRPPTERRDLNGNECEPKTLKNSCGRVVNSGREKSPPFAAGVQFQPPVHIIYRGVVEALDRVPQCP
jgi:hypothetical protein